LEIKLDRPSIDETIDDWKASCGEIKTSERGVTYLVVPIPNLRGNFLNLIQTFVDRGYTEIEIKSVSINTKIAKACWSDLIIKLSPKDIKRNRDITTSIWRETLKEYFAKPISEYVETKKESIPTKSISKERTLEVQPKDRIKMDTSDMVEAPLDLEFLKELGLEESDVNNE
jgi:hypothetical protein